MKYMGSKSRLAKFLIPEILKYHNKNATYVEPFVGGGNLIQHISGRRIGSDFNSKIIEALIIIRDFPDKIPKNNKEYTEKDYNNIKLNPSLLNSFAAFAYSYNGKHLGGYAKCNANRDYVKEAYHNAQKQSPRLQGVELYHCAYDKLKIPPKSLIYCDPPYYGTEKYRAKFNTQHFCQWVKSMKNAGHIVLVSEYTNLDNWDLLWSDNITSGFGQKTNEKLFKI